MSDNINFNDLKRYSRQIVLPDFGIEGQNKIQKSHVLVIGCGGLGSPVLLFLTAAGIGNIGCIDFDIVSESNLHRQILFDEKDLGLNKVEVAVRKLSLLNSNVKFSQYFEKLTSNNVLEIFQNYDLIIDCSDNFPTRYLVNDACEMLNKPYIYAAIHQFEAQLAVFNYQGSVTYRDVFANPPTPEQAPDCSTAGVFGALAGTIGSMQALEAIKLITGIGTLVTDALLLMDYKDMVFRKIKIKKDNSRTPINGLIDYDVFCGIDNSIMLGVNKQEFLANKEKYFLIDIRSAQEHKVLNLGGVNWEAASVNVWLSKIQNLDNVLLYCTTGKRSGFLAEKLNNQAKSTRVKFLDSNINDCI